MKGLAQGSCSLQTLAWARGFISRSKSARSITLLHGLPAGLVNLLKQSTLYEWSPAPPKSMAKLPLISLEQDFYPESSKCPWDLTHVQHSHPQLQQRKGKQRAEKSPASSLAQPVSCSDGCAQIDMRISLWQYWQAWVWDRCCADTLAQKQNFIGQWSFVLSSQRVRA